MLKLSTKGRYGLRAMIDLAASYDEAHTPIMMSDIAARQSLSRKYLHALLTPLKNAGLLRSARGAKGGYYLAKPPDEITVKAILTILEGEVNLVDCLTEGADCERIPVCRAHGIWKELNDNIAQMLDRLTLNDILCDGKLSKEIPI